MSEKKKLKRKNMFIPKSAGINDNELPILKKIVDDNPNCYLDELVLLFGTKTGKLIHYSTMWDHMTKH